MSSSLRPSERGFSMVELMVAMLIGLIGTIIIFQVFEVSEGIKRTTMSGGDAQQNGAVSLYVIERDLRNAGMGFNDTSYAGCNVLAYDSKRAVPNFTLRLVPVFITPGGAATVPDQVTVFYGSKPQIANPTVLFTNMTPGGNGSDPLVLRNPYAYHPGDLIALLQPASGFNCSLMEVTAVDLNTNTVTHDDVAYLVLETLKNERARFNQPGGLGVEYAGVGTGNVTRVFNLGNLFEPASNPNRPVNNTYAVAADNTLTVTAAFVDKSAPSSPLTSAAADNIVQLRAEYGVDDGVAGVGNGIVPFTNVPGVYTAGDGLVDRWVPPATFNALVTPPLAGPPWQSVIAVRLAVVARSAQPEKPRGSNGANCDATTDGTELGGAPDQRPVWSGGLIDVSGSGDPDPASMTNWKCYRYRVFETTVPLRNWIWKSS
jgi:type IV pilus assembly protein PilW